MEFESIIKYELKCIVKRRKKDRKLKFKEIMCRKHYYYLQFVEESTKCITLTMGALLNVKPGCGRRR